MSLLDDLRAIEDFPPSHAPTVHEVLELVGKLAAYVEHGADLLDAAQAGKLHELLSPPLEPVEPPAAPDPDQSARIAELEQQLATARAAAQRTQADPPPASEQGGGQTWEGIG